MTGFKLVLLSAVAGCCLMATAPKATAQLAVEIGAAPDCPYGYYDAAPYNCAPYGYYGPEWFSGGIFVGSGPWFHGDNNFRGHVNNRFHPDHGYRGATPRRAIVSTRSHTSKEMKFVMDAATQGTNAKAISQLAQGSGCPRSGFPDLGALPSQWMRRVRCAQRVLDRYSLAVLAPPYIASFGPSIICTPI